MRFHARVFPRDVLEDAVRQLADDYPAAFFADGRKRRPLKSSILADLQKDGADDELLSGADYYMQSWQYLGCLQAGAERVDLSGKKAGTVTESEQLAAQKRVQAEKEEAKNKNAETAVAKPTKPKPDLPPVKYGAPAASAPAPETPPLARLEVLAKAVSNLYATTDDTSLRTALTVAALKHLAGEVEKVVVALEK